MMDFDDPLRWDETGFPSLPSVAQRPPAMERRRGERLEAQKAVKRAELLANARAIVGGPPQTFLYAMKYESFRLEVVEAMLKAMETGQPPRWEAIHPVDGPIYL